MRVVAVGSACAQRSRLTCRCVTDAPHPRPPRLCPPVRYGPTGSSDSRFSTQPSSRRPHSPATSCGTVPTLQKSKRREVRPGAWLASVPSQPSSPPQRCMCRSDRRDSWEQSATRERDSRPGQPGQRDERRCMWVASSRVCDARRSSQQRHAGTDTTDSKHSQHQKAATSTGTARCEAGGQCISQRCPHTHLLEGDAVQGRHHCGLQGSQQPRQRRLALKGACAAQIQLEVRAAVGLGVSRQLAACQTKLAHLRAGQQDDGGDDTLRLRAPGISQAQQRAAARSTALRHAQLCGRPTTAGRGSKPHGRAPAARHAHQPA